MFTYLLFRLGQKSLNLPSVSWVVWAAAPCILAPHLCPPPQHVVWCLSAPLECKPVVDGGLVKLGLHCLAGPGPAPGQEQSQENFLFNKRIIL